MAYRVTTAINAPSPTPAQMDNAQERHSHATHTVRLATVGIAVKRLALVLFKENVLVKLQVSFHIFLNE